MLKHNVRILSVVAFLVALSATAQAWVYPEHREIALRAVLMLDSTNRNTLNEIWTLARVGHEDRLPAFIVVPHQPESPRFIDWAAWPAISGDHSCSPQEMIKNVLESDWIFEVAHVTERLRRRLESAHTRADRVNALRDQDIELQRADPEYVTRAGANNAHFLLARSSYKTTVEEFVLSSLAQGDEINALGIYVWCHYRALAKVSRIRTAATAEERQALALAALADEAFGLHFLEDVFAAGHVAGTWGNASLRKGTHDYYNEHGLETTTWSGEPLVLLGDAYMTANEIDIPAEVVKLSLMQLIQAYEGAEPFASHRFDPVVFDGAGRAEPDTMNTCMNIDMPGSSASTELKQSFVDVLRRTPIPALTSGAGELPRFRSELGAFIGLSPFLRGFGISGGYDNEEVPAGGIGGMGMTIRLGYGLDGVTSESGDGLIYIEGGLNYDNPSSNSFYEGITTETAGSIVSAIPARNAISTRIRMPFWLLPGDLILGAIVVAPFSFSTFTQMAVVAGNGGVIPWQAGIATPLGRLQFVLGREIGVNFYGTGTPDKVIVDKPGSDTELAILEFSTIQLEFPIVELRPFRTFSTEQSSALFLQIFGGADIPTSWKVLNTVSYSPQLHTIYTLGVRMAFDWRYYF